MQPARSNGWQDHPAASYLQSQFLELPQRLGIACEALPAARAAMSALAKAFKPEPLAGEAFGLYEEFRPRIPEGVAGWGAKGELDLNCVRALAPKR
jgi:hypothetical protein